MSPKTGRPTTDRKGHEKKIRLSDMDLKKLDFCQKVLGIPKSEVIRQGIERMYVEAQHKAEK